MERTKVAIMGQLNLGMREARLAMKWVLCGNLHRTHYVESRIMRTAMGARASMPGQARLAA
jgi:hypothetical protein